MVIHLSFQFFNKCRKGRKSLPEEIVQHEMGGGMQGVNLGRLIILGVRNVAKEVELI